MNNAFKRLLPTDTPLVDLFHALKSMNKAYEEARAFMEFQMRDRHRVYPDLIFCLAGKVPPFIFDLVECEYTKMRELIIEIAEDGHVSFADNFQVSNGCSCDCPFFLQYSAPCAHLWKVAGEAAINLVHPAWRVSNEPVAPAAILYGPMQDPRILKGRRQSESTDVISNCKQDPLIWDECRHPIH